MRAKRSRSPAVGANADPLVLIARASGCRVRRVTLEADWWRRDAGPLLGVVGEEERPVALLPRRGRYEAIDPVRGQRWTVDAASAEDVSLAAHSFHPALPAQLHDLGGLLRFGLRGRGADLAAIFAAGLVAALLGMLAPVATGYLMGTAIPDADVLSLWHVSAGLVAAAIGALSFTLIQGLITTRMGISADVATQTALWDRVLRTHVAALRRWSTGDLQSRLLAVSQVARQLHGVTLSTLLSGVLALLNAGLMLYYSPELAAWGLGAGVLAVALSAALGRAAARRELALQEGQGALHGTVIQLVGAVPKLRVANAEARGFTQWLRRLTPQLRLQDEIRGYQDLLAAWSLALPTLTAMVLFYALSDSLLEAQTDPSEAPLGTGDFLAFHAAFGVFLMGLNKLSDMVVTLASAFATARRVRPILEAPPEVPEHAASPGRLRGAFALQGVTFRYRSDGAKILDTVSLHADPGEFVALVGPSGSGKSTILRLLLGFEVCESGSVRFDGQDLSGLDPGAVRQQLGIVLQSGRLSYGSILDNVTGSLDLELHEVWQALEDAGLAEDVRALPMQLHTHVSEGGGNLSGGQRQRLLIARALAKNPRLILFDEATSALDNRTQAIVSRALERRRATRLVVAHRLSTIEHADRIYVLEDGRVVQTGTFTELRDQPGLFQRLAARQTT